MMEKIKKYIPIEFLIYPKKTDRYISKMEYEYQEKMGFSIGYNGTDHFWFECRKCKRQAEVIKVKRDDKYAGIPTIYFHLRCQECEIIGHKKIYIED